MDERLSLCVSLHQSDGEFEAEHTAGSTSHSLLHIIFEELLTADYIITLSVKQHTFILQ